MTTLVATVRHQVADLLVVARPWDFADLCEVIDTDCLDQRVESLSALCSTPVVERRTADSDLLHLE